MITPRNKAVYQLSTVPNKFSLTNSSHTVAVYEDSSYVRDMWQLRCLTTANNFSFHLTSGYATMVHGRGCNPHRSTTTFANLEITSLWRHWWRHNSETIRGRQKRRPPRAWKSSELSNGETASLYDNFCKTGNYVIYDVIIWVQDGNCKKWLKRILVLVHCTI